MRVPINETEVPKPMQGAWHVDARTVPMPSLLKPADLVAAVFDISLGRLAIGDEVGTIFGKFFVDDLHVDPSTSHVLLHTWAPGSVSRFAITVQRLPQRGFRAILHNSVHPNSWLGRFYFRAIAIGHHVAMEIALRRLTAKARHLQKAS